MNALDAFSNMRQAAVRTQRYRYIRYQDGGEELYDHQNDPLEWNNLAGDPKQAKLKAELAEALPQTWAESAPTKGAFAFDPDAFTWRHKKNGTITRGK